MEHTLSLVTRPSGHIPTSHAAVAKRDLRAFFAGFGNQVQIIESDSSVLSESLQSALGEIVICTDLSLSTPLAEVVALLAYLAQFPEIHFVIGDRISSRKNRGFRLSGWNRLLHFLIQTRWRLGVADPLCPLFAIRKAELQKLLPALKSRDQLVATELILRARSYGVKVGSLPVQVVQHAHRFRWQDRFRSLFDFLRLACQFPSSS